MGIKQEDKSSKYFGVTKRKKPATDRWGRPRNFIFLAHLNLPSGQWNKSFETEREAAIAVDMKLIEIGKPPRNILKPAK